MIAVGKTDIGLVRSQNQDSICIHSDSVGTLPNLFIVADGMGGHNAGDVASNTAINAFCQYAQQNRGQEILDTLIGGVQFANSEVYRMSKTDESLSNMGTTFVGVSVSGENTYVAHVGDSRLYRIREGKIAQITNDHSLINDMLRSGEITVEEAKLYPYKNIITRAVGTNASVNVDGLVEKNIDGDILLLCSDGLSGMLSRQEILDIVSDENISLEERADKLVELAKSHGGLDNISVILVVIGGDEG